MGAMNKELESVRKTGYFVCYKHWRLPAEEVRKRQSVQSKALIADAYSSVGNGVRPICTCIGARGLELEVRKFETGMPFLARWKGQRASHAPNCPFSLPSHGGDVDRKPAVELHGGGLSFKVKVTLEPMAEDRPEPPNSISSPASDAAAVARASIELTGMLDDCFEFLGLDTYRPGTVRTHQSVMPALRALSSKSELNRKAMSDFVHFAVQGDSLEVWHERRTVMQDRKRPGRKRCLVVVGEISAVRDAKDGVNVHLRGVDSPFPMDGEMLYDVRTQFRSAWLRARAKNTYGESKVIAIMVITLDEDGSIIVHRCCVKVLSRQYLLCDSYNEVKVANKLIAYGRAFRKPLSTADGETYRPDFELLDVHCRWIMEVWGLDDQKYLEQKIMKINYWINEIKAKLWQWNALNARAITTFPSMASLAKSRRVTKVGRAPSAAQMAFLHF